MTPPLPDRIAAAILTLAERVQDHALVGGRELRDRMFDAIDSLKRAIAEVVAERDAAQERVDLDIDEFRRILAELDNLRVRIAPTPEGCRVLYDLVQGIVLRAINAGRQRVPLIVQRDNAVEERDAATKRADGLAADLAACVVARDKALADAEAADAAQIAHQKKWESVCKASRENGTCACSYDSADDVCDFHAPKLAAVKADLAAAQAKLAELLAAAKDVAAIDCDPFAVGGLAAELRLRRAIAAAEQGGAQSGQPAQRDDDGTASGGSKP